MSLCLCLQSCVYWNSLLLRPDKCFRTLVHCVHVNTHAYRLQIPRYMSKHTQSHLTRCLFGCPGRGPMFTGLWCRSTTSRWQSDSLLSRHLCLSHTGSVTRILKPLRWLIKLILILKTRELLRCFMLYLRRCGTKKGSFLRRKAFLKFTLNEVIFFSVESDNPVCVWFSCACFRHFFNRKY